MPPDQDELLILRDWLAGELEKATLLKVADRGFMFGSADRTPEADLAFGWRGRRYEIVIRELDSDGGTPPG